MKENDTYRLKGLRRALTAQLESKGIQDKSVLAAIESVPRHLFFGRDTVFHTTQAYEDKAFPIASGQTISQPFTVAQQTQLLQIGPRQKVLEIGTGSGYQAAILDTLGAKVFSIERHRTLYELTKAQLENMGYENVKCFFGDGFEGLPTYAPFDRIIITAAVSDFPKKLLHQLMIGGLLVMPFGTETKCKMVRITKHEEDQYTHEEFGDFSFVPMLKGKVF